MGLWSHSKFRKNNNHGFSTLSFIFSTGFSSFALLQFKPCQEFLKKKKKSHGLICGADFYNSTVSMWNFLKRYVWNMEEKIPPSYILGIWGKAIWNTMFTGQSKNVKYSQSCSAFRLGFFSSSEILGVKRNGKKITSLY